MDELRDDAGRLTLMVKIDEGRPSKIRKMDYKGLEQLPSGEMDDIDDALPIHAGDPFTRTVREGEGRPRRSSCSEHGFAQAQVQGRVEVAPEDG